MREQEMGRRRGVTILVLAAVLASVAGLGLVFSSTTRPTSAHASAPRTKRLQSGNRDSRPTTPTTVAPIGALSTTSLVNPIVPMSDPATTTTRLAPKVSVTSVIAPTTTTPPAASPAPADAPRTKQHATLSPVATVPSPADAQAAVGLMAAINRQAGRQSAIPRTAENVSLLERWMANEGGLWADNPLNTSLDSAAYPHQFTTSGQDTGIPIFPSLASGLTATASTLLSNASYARILRILRSGRAPCLRFAKAVIQSPWASGHYHHDPAGFCSGRIVPVRRVQHHHAR
jgi:hypothetical protein